MGAAALLERLAARPPRRVLVVQTAFLGDTVFTSALVGSLAARWPQAQVDLCVAPRGRDVALAIPGVGRVFVFDKRGVDRGLRGLWRTARALREGQHELAVVPHRSLRSALVARLARIPERLGFETSSGSFLFTARAEDVGKTFLDREASLGRALGAAPGALRLVPTAGQAAAARDALARAGALGRPLAALCVGSEWETKVWPPERFAALAALLFARGLLPLLLGGPRETGLAARVAAGSPCVNTVGNPVGEALGLLAQAKVCVGGDSGLVHAARALGVPTVALFGPTSPKAHRFGPAERAITLGLVCSPCSAHGGRRCPLGHHRCLRDLEAERVAAACAELVPG